MKDDIKKYIDFIEPGLPDRKICFDLDEISTYISRDSHNRFIILTNSSDYSIVYKIYNYIISKGYEISKVIINIDDNIFNSPGICELDYKYVNYIRNHAKKNNLQTSIYFNYGYIFNADYEDYIGLVESLRWYRSILKEYKLSPLELLTCAYDIVKTFYYYNDARKNNEVDSANTPHLIIKTGKIVCLGYNRILKEILRGLSKNVKIDEFTTMCYEGKYKSPEFHSRSIVRVDDNKYNVHGIYMLDPTWDCVEDSRKIIYGNECDSLSGYRYFLVPISQYRRFFKGDTYPRLYKGELEGYEKRLTRKKLTEMINNPLVSNKDLRDIGINFYNFPNVLSYDMKYKNFLRYLNSKRPDYNKFLKLIFTVRLVEGYSISDLDKMLVYGINSDDKDRSYLFDLSDSNEKKLML